MKKNLLNLFMRMHRIRSKLQKKKLRGDIGLVALALILLVLPAAQDALAVDETYNRPNPLMDYVPQDIGIYDTAYAELEESDCRSCHGNSLADRHHLTDTVAVDGCAPCHYDEVTDYPVVIARNCLTSGCHSWDDVDTNGWHHNTDLSASGNCIACHDPNLIAEITPFSDFTTYPPSVITPTPFSCENCHWEQNHSSTGDPDDPGHPSTYDHYDVYGNFVGFHEYSLPIYGNKRTHHMGFQGNMSPECYTCHSLNINSQDWNPYNPEIIRYCEKCHSAESLHSIDPHVQETNGWEAVGFHVPASNTATNDMDPTVYRTWDPTGPYLPETTDGFTSGQMCFACHGDNVPEQPADDDCTDNVPVIDTTVDGIQPNRGTCGATVTLRGNNFGEEHTAGRTVQLRRKNESLGEWTNMPIASWTDTRIEFMIPCVLLPAGNYRVKVVTECGDSNMVNFALNSAIWVQSISPDNGPCGQWITIQGEYFGPAQSRIFADGYQGVHRVVNFVSSQGTLTAIGYRNWSSWSFQVRFAYFFEDGIDPVTGVRNYVQDDGSGTCPEEPTQVYCPSVPSGVWSVYVNTIYFGDEDGSGDLSCGDTIFQVVIDDPHYFEITNVPSIFRLNPTKIERRQLIKIVGVNFGPTQTDGQVFMGTTTQYDNDDGVLLSNIKRWSNTKIKVRVNVPLGWEGKVRCLWIEKGGLKSNYRNLRILEPLP